MEKITKYSSILAGYLFSIVVADLYLYNKSYKQIKGCKFEEFEDMYKHKVNRNILYGPIRLFCEATGFKYINITKNKMAYEYLKSWHQ